MENWNIIPVSNFESQIKKCDGKFWKIQLTVSYSCQNITGEKCRRTIQGDEQECKQIHQVNQQNRNFPAKKIGYLCEKQASDYSAERVHEIYQQKSQIIRLRRLKMQPKWQ